MFHDLDCEIVVSIKLAYNQERKVHLRSKYNVKGHLWHIWYFVIFCAIDGFSRLLVILECLDNNKAKTVFAGFVEEVKVYGLL